MKWFFLLVSILLVQIQVLSQALTSKNFREWYNPDSEISITIQLVKSDNQLEVYYHIQSNQFTIDKYTISWEKRDTYTQRDGIAIAPKDSTINRQENSIKGKWLFDSPEKPWLLVVKVTNKESQVSWVNYKLLEANYPARGWVENKNERYTKKYFTANEPYTIQSKENNTFYVSYFKEDFPAAYPPFSEKESKVDRFMFYDSLFALTPGNSLSLQKHGLYLFQKDTNAAEGFSVRVVNKSFPKFSSIQDLKKPLIYICTQDEYIQLENAKDDKTKFDKVILTITNDKERASNFMKGYYRRVELANLYFSSYKEGWKTDRGMIYLIFGLPDEVSVSDGSENWYYKASKTQFTFVKSGSVYDPDNYILLRDKKFSTIWFSTVDMWRKSRY
jgi:GWxTD domain-containing protein